MAIVQRPCFNLSMNKQLTGYLLMSIVAVGLSLKPAICYSQSGLSSNHIDGDDTQTNQIPAMESTVTPDNNGTINSSISHPVYQISSSLSSNTITVNKTTQSPSATTTTSSTTVTINTDTPTSTSTTLPPPLPTPLPSKGYPKLYSGSRLSLYSAAMDNLLGPKASYLGRTKRMKRSRPNTVKSQDLNSGNPFSLIKYLLANQHYTSPSNDDPMSYTLIGQSKPGQFGTVYGNLEDLLDRNDFTSGMSKIYSHYNPEQSASFYPLTASDIEDGDDAFDSGFGGGDDGWNNQGTIDFINQLESDSSNGKQNIDLFPLESFIPIRSYRTYPLKSSSSQQSSNIFTRPVIAMKRKRRQNGSYNKAFERSPSSIILGSSPSSLFGGGAGNRYQSRSNANQYEQLVNRINDNPLAYL